ncbi:unnamed protein product [Paramecium sonneborni]|uniref:Uncharacterized protein n=1 Tax=Paramecium sonneborni TaxID=65129 RepID=A0A8S1RQX2_9CILI|nr:unnamed protein product [Paramecium sonneborni]
MLQQIKEIKQQKVLNHFIKEDQDLKRQQSIKLCQVKIQSNQNKPTKNHLLDNIQNLDNSVHSFSKQQVSSFLDLFSCAEQMEEQHHSFQKIQAGY